MSVWDKYKSRISASESPKRDVYKERAQNVIKRKQMHSLSYVSITNENGDEQNVRIVDTEDFSIKNIYSVPGETLNHGEVIEWMDSHWLITDLDAHDELYTKGVINRCNFNLKWRDDDTGDILSRWCIVEDGTKYLIGEKDKDIMSTGDSRIALTIAKDDDTKKFKRGMRLLVDDNDAEETLAYEITKSNRLYNMYDGVGVYRFILRETVTTDDDNKESYVADYYGKGFKEPPTTPSEIKATGVYI